MEKFLTKIWLVRFVLVCSLLIAGLLMLLSSLNDSPTSDEPPHILSGYVFLKFGHDFIDIEHPHLSKSLAAVPLVLQDIKTKLTDPNYLTQERDLDIGKMFDTSRNFLSYETNDPNSILLSSRLPMLILTLIFTVPLFLFTKKLFGNLAATIAVFLYCSEPFILANGPLVNTDIAASGFFLTTIFALYLYSQQQTRRNLVFLSLALTAAVLTKFSTFYLIPIVLFLLELIYRTKQIKGKRFHAIILIGIILITISLFYGIIGFREESFKSFLALSYFKGLMVIFFSVTTDQRFSYLNGESYFGGRWYYFPILLLLKTQLVTLAFALLGAVLLYLRKFPVHGLDLLIVFLAPTLFFLIALGSSFNIGLRHIMPVYPFLLMLAGFAISFSFSFLRDRVSLNVAYISIVLVIIFRFSTLATTFPNFLSYYNILAGGTDNGWKIANDANYDWGQDVKRLAEFVKDNRIESIAFDNYTGDYAAKLYYNIPITRISPKDTDYKGYLALSTSVITYHEDRSNNYDWVIKRYETIAKAGKSIFIYKIE